MKIFSLIIQLSQFSFLVIVLKFEIFEIGHNDYVLIIYIF